MKSKPYWYWYGAPALFLAIGGCFEASGTVRAGTGTSTGSAGDNEGTHGTGLLGTSKGTDNPSSYVTTVGETTTGTAGCERPTGTIDQFVIYQGESLVIQAAGLLTNDVDHGGEGLKAMPLVGPSAQGASVDVNTDGSFMYIPPPWLWGLDSFEYQVCCATDDLAACDAARVEVLVRPVDIALSDVARPHGGFVIEGENPGDYAGESVSAGGDVNGDGHDDVLIGSPLQNFAGLSAGRTYVVYGKTDLAPVFLADVAQGTGGFALHGEAAEDRSGQSIGGLGDVDGDTFDDFIVSAPGAQLEGISGVGRAYVVYGSVHVGVSGGAIPLSDIASGSGGFAIEGELFDDGGFGGSAKGVGDIDAGGVADLIVTAPRVGASFNAGRAYVLFGEQRYANPVPASDIWQGNIASILIEGEASQDRLNRARWVGDLNGDGRAEIGVGTYLADPNGPLSGAVWIVNGSTQFGGTATNIYLGDVGATVPGVKLEGQEDWDEFGYDLTGVGDIDDDGYNDLLVGAYRANPNGNNSGRVYLFFGGPSGVDPHDVLELEGEAAGSWAGVTVGGAGDFDGDGLTDLLIGSPNAGGEGRCYFLYGNEALRDAERIQLADVAGDWGFVLKGDDTTDNHCAPVGFAGDVNGDGLSDLFVAARQSDHNGDDAGRVYIVFGVPSTLSP